MSEYKNYVKHPPKIRAKKMEEDFVVEVDGEKCQGLKGDYIMIDMQGKQCVCSCAEFESCHEEVHF